MKTKEIQLGPKIINIPNEWDSDLTKNLVSLQSGNGFKSSKYQESGIPLIKISNIQNDNVLLSKDQDYLPKDYIEKYSKYLLEKDDLLIALSGATTGKMGFVDNNILPALLNQRVGKITSSNEDVNKKFIGFYLTKKIIKDYIRISAQASAQQNISLGFIRKIPVPKPPLPEQEKIAEVLSTVDQAIEKTDKIIEESKLAKKGLMQDLLTKGIGHSEFKEVELGPKTLEIPKNWNMMQLKDAAHIEMGSSPPSETYNNNEDGLPFFQGNAEFGSMYPDLKKWCTKPQKSADKNDVLISVRAPVGAVNIAPFKCCIGRGLAAVKGKKIDKRLLFYFLKYLEFIFESLSQGSTFSSINKKTLETLDIFLPPENEQKEIAEILSSVDEKIKKEKEYKQKLKKLKKGLMQDLLTGKVRVTNLINN